MLKIWGVNKHNKAAVTSSSKRMGAFRKDVVSVSELMENEMSLERTLCSIIDGRRENET